MMSVASSLQHQRNVRRRALNRAVRTIIIKIASNLEMSRKKFMPVNISAWVWWLISNSSDRESGCGNVGNGGSE
jgi:hypothetical protein